MSPRNAFRPTVPAMAARAVPCARKHGCGQLQRRALPVSLSRATTVLLNASTRSRSASSGSLKNGV